MISSNLLIELLVEELPPKVLNKLGESFASLIFDSLKTQGLARSDSQSTSFSTPRRLAVHITNILSQAEDTHVSHKLMPASVGIDVAGNPTATLIKKLGSLGQDISVFSSLRKESDGKADLLYLDAIQKGCSLTSGLQNAIDVAISKLPIPKVMTYQLEDGWESVNFVRPAHGLIALHGKELISIHVLGLKSGNHTKGHRFEAASENIVIPDADSYESVMLKQGGVIVSFDKRREFIIKHLASISGSEGLQPILDDALLDEVTALVERPNLLLGKFEDEFLEVPQECLILTMKANQKYFPLLDSNGKLTNKFVIVSNISPNDPSKVISGNERVVRPRLADAKFFYNQDRKRTLESRLANLNKVVYHNLLGSQGDRSTRVTRLSEIIAQKLGGDRLTQSAMAAKLSKADLLTDMVGEFPELQGIMGRYYAIHEGLDEDIAYAIEDHYKPRFAGDSIPRNDVGVVVALADKLEILAGLFSIGQIPTGDKDPFALRRQALGIVRLLIEKRLPLSLDELISIAFSLFEKNASQAESVLTDFIYERLSSNLREQGYSAQEVEAVLSIRPQFLFDVPKQIEAVRIFSHIAEAPALAAANKRVSNILKKSSIQENSEINLELLKEPAEQQLAQAISVIKPKADILFNSGEFTESLKLLAELKAPVDRFFDEVMVNVDDQLLKENRLSLLNKLHQAMNRVADLSKLAG